MSLLKKRSTTGFYDRIIEKAALNKLCLLLKNHLKKNFQLFAMGWAWVQGPIGLIKSGGNCKCFEERLP
jgi:hypothetical protein